MPDQQVKAEWYCKGCGALHKLDTGSGMMELASLGMPVKGSLTCESCMTRHEIADVIAGKFATTRRASAAARNDDDAANAAAEPAPVLRLSFASVAFVLLAVEGLIYVFWDSTGGWLILTGSSSRSLIKD